jgi:subtilisin family serine protease/glucose/arabinose dehydrogenase
VASHNSRLPHFAAFVALALLLCLSKSLQAEEPPEIKEAATGAGASVTGRQTKEERTGEILVRLKERPDQAKADNVARSAGASLAEKADRSGLLKLEVPGDKVDATLASLAADPQVVEAGRNLVIRPLELPNDEHFSFQWHLQANSGINAAAAWDLAPHRGGDTIVAVIDTGLAYENYTDSSGRRFERSPDLAATTIIAPYDFVDDDSHPNDEHGHGTHVAGTIAGNTNNTYAVAGLASGARIMPLRVVDWTGSGSVEDLVEAIYYAVDKGARLINLSLGALGTGSPDANGVLCTEVIGLGAALDYAHAAGVVVVAAAGNNGAVPICPAAYPTVIAAGSFLLDGSVAPYSNRGATLDVSAPGGEPAVDRNGDGFSGGVLQNTYCSSPEHMRASGRYGGFCDVWRAGTSMASAHVTGTLALLLGERPQLSRDALRSAIQSSAVDAGATGWDSAFGWGRLDAAAALRGVGLSAATPTPAQNTPPTSTPATTVTPTPPPEPSPSATPPPPLPSGGPSYPASVAQLDVASARVIDGDTLEVWNGNVWGIGYIGVEAPQGNTACGRQATERQWSLAGGGVRLEQEGTYDLDLRGRRLYHALTPSGELIGEVLIREGLARASHFAHSYLARYEAAEAEARTAGRGCLWGGDRSQTQPSPAPLSMGTSFALERQALPGGFTQDLVVSGLTEPTVMSFLPDGRILLGLKNGVVRVYKNGALLTTPFIDIRSRVNDYWDHGIIGMAVDPDFDQNQDGTCKAGASCYVYLLYTYENDAEDYFGSKSGRLARYTVSGDTASPASEVVLLGTVVGAGCPVANQDCIPSEYSSHSVGNVKFAADGTLFVTTGDAASFNQVDDRALRAQNLDSLAGKLLHITKTGQGVPQNPFWNGNAGANRSKVYAYGLRNPYRFNQRPGTNAFYTGDVGWNEREEVSAATPGANLGWPCYEGTSQQAGYASKPVCVALYNQGPSAVKAPVIDWSHNAFGGCCSSAVTGGVFYSASNYPAQYQGKYVFGDYGKEFMKYLAVDANDVMQPGSLTDFQTTPGAVVDIELGPDGNIYYIDIGAGGLKRIRYVGGGNRPPTAMMSAEPTQGPTPLTITFSASGSFDPDANPLTYTWNFGDGSPNGSQQIASHTYTVAGVYIATLTVSDGLGGVDTKTVEVAAGSFRPTATISQPASTFTYAVGDTISYAGSATDPEDGALPATALAWQVLIHHCPGGGSCHTHFHQTGISGSGGSFVVPDHGDDFYFEIILTANDSDGLTDTKSVSIHPRTAPVTLETNPGGLQIVYDGVAQTTPVVHNSVVGSTHTIEAPSPQGGATFSSWSDGGAKQHVITIGPGGGTFTASFAQNPVITFNDKAGQDQPLNGQYPTGVVNWGSGTWYHSGPWGLMTTKSASFTGAAQTSASFTFMTPRRLISIEAFNGGGGATTVTLSCAGQPNKAVSVGANQLVAISTGWTGTCTTVTVQSTNGWNTNFDNLVHDAGGPVTNQAPVVSAGADQSLTLPAAASLDGSVSDDGLPSPPGVVSVTWTQVSGPGSVSFADAGQVDTTASFTAAGTYVLRLTANDGGLSASDELTVSVLPPNAAPTVATAASASPNPVSGSTAVLSVLGADDGGEAALVYTWAMVTGPAAPSFSANASNAAKNTTATFSRAGSYLLRAVIRDAGNQTVTSDVSVNVEQTPSQIAVTPATATVAINGSQQFAASARDQFGQALSVQPGFAWSVSGGGTINAAGLFTAGPVAGGPHTVTATSGSIQGSATVSVTAATQTITFDDKAGQDQPLNGQYPTGVVNWGSGTWYHSAPWGLMTTKSASFTGAAQTSASFTFMTPRRLTSIEAFNGGGGATMVTLSCAGQPNKVVNVGANQLVAISTGWTGTCTTVTLQSTNGWNTNFDNFVHDAGGPVTNQAPVVSAGADHSLTLPATAALDGSVSDDGLPSPPGAVSVAWTQVSGPGSVTFGDAGQVDTTASFSAAGTYVLRLTGNDGGLTASDELTVTVLPPNAAPSVATAASASPNPVSGSTAGLSVLGADDGGEAALLYTWAMVTGPVAPSFSANASNAAKNTTATFSRAGSYLLRAVIRDAGNQTVTSDVSVSVEQTPSQVVVTPATATVAVNGSQQFAASVRDQFGQALSTQPGFAWSVSGGGTITAAGLFTAGPVAGGPHTVTATSGSIQGSATVSVSSAPSGLVAAYGFSEASGTGVIDASGSGNNGTISGATRTASGKYGSALSFDGANDRVNIPDSNSLDLTSGMTLEAWVRPSSLGGWDTVLLKEQPGNLLYALYANTGPGPASGEIETATGYYPVYALGSMALNTWTHLAATYDGSTLRLYLNGAEVSSRAVVGSLNTSSGALRIGGNAVWGEYFAGLIDEVRIYNRPLNQQEIEADLNAAIN